MTSRTTILICLLFMLTMIPIETSPISSPSYSSSVQPSAPPTGVGTNNVLSADGGTQVGLTPYVIIELIGSSIPARGAQIAVLLSQSSIVVNVLSVNDIVGDAGLIQGAPAIILDASVGSDNGSVVPNAFFSSLIACDVPLVLMGRASWILHRLKGQGPPSMTAFAYPTFNSIPDHAGAVYLSFPIQLTEGSSLTTETGVSVPINRIQTERSRLVNLTASSDTSQLAPLRYDSWPNDAFLIGADNPSLLTGNGTGLLINTIAYASTLRESTTSQAIMATQATNGLLPGGFAYPHEPSLESAYYAVHGIKSLLNSSQWGSWVSDNSPLIEDLLAGFYVDMGAESGFKPNSGQAVGNATSAMGLWLVEALGLTSSFSVSELVSYLSSQQNLDGGFENDITTTYHVIEALETTGSLGTIDTTEAESWLLECIVDGGDILDAKYWGGAAVNPYSYRSQNSYSLQLVLSLGMLSTSLSDGGNMVQWILDHTANGDGSYNNAADQPGETVTGTSCALTALDIQGGLAPENRTSGLAWLSSAQPLSGGYGLTDAEYVGKVRESSSVATSLNQLGASISGIYEFFEKCKTGIGFEVVDPEPSLMWGYWSSLGARYSHAEIDRAASLQYLSRFEDQWQIYPDWDNTTWFYSPEYSFDRYSYGSSTWAQLFAAGMFDALGETMSPSGSSYVWSFLTNAQHASGHYMQRKMFGTPLMQYSVAAVEAGYLSDSLSYINDRTALENAIMSEYQSGTWSTTGWTIRPYVNQQQAIDYLSTRSALRLDLVDQTMANDIASTIESRIQYSDLWLLSRDVATLALLNSSFSISLESINRTRILQELSICFIEGWFNSTTLWQPLITADVLEMVSILGLRDVLANPSGGQISAQSTGLPQLGGILSLDVKINSAKTTHTVYVHAFDVWTPYDNVSNTDTLDIPVPDTSNWLGNNNVSVMLHDYGDSRAYNSSQANITGSLSGTLNVETPDVLIGDLVNGTLSWTLSTGEDAGLTQVTVRLGDGATYQEWTYENQTSPFSLSVPTQDFSAGDYNLTTTLTRPLCDVLVLIEPVRIDAPDLTYLSASAPSSGDVGQAIAITWSLHLESNNSNLISQLVLLEIENSTHVVHTDSGISVDGNSEFLWSPSVRGNYSYRLSFVRNGTLESSSISDIFDIYENTTILWQNAGTHDQYTVVSVSAQLLSQQGQPLAGYSLTVTATSPSSVTVFDSTLVTNATGHITVLLTLDENGQYDIVAIFVGVGYLNPTSSSDTVIAWSSSTLAIGGVPSEAYVAQQYTLWGLLNDSAGSPIVSEQVTLRILLLPSTLIHEETQTTNNTGCVSLSWTPTTSGSYSLEAEYSGSVSRGPNSANTQVSTFVLLSLSLGVSLDPQVGVAGWLAVTVRDHTGTLVSGVTATIVVRGPSGQVDTNQSGITVSGILNIAWTPSLRGTNSINVTVDSQLWYERNSILDDRDVMEQAKVGIEWTTPTIAVGTSTLVVTVLDSTGVGVENISFQTTVTIDTTAILDTANITGADGTVTFDVLLDIPGLVSVTVSVASQQYLLAATNQTPQSVLGQTDLQLTLSGLPIDQGTTQSIIATLTDWSGTPLTGSTVTVWVEEPDGTRVLSVNLTTGIDGKCALTHDFDIIGDYMVGADYAGEVLNGSASTSQVQRVYVTPNIILLVNPTSLLGDTVQLEVALTDNFGQYIEDRTVTLTVTVDGSVVFTSQFQSELSLSMIHWNPTDRGLAAIDVLLTPGFHHLDNSTQSSISVLEVVDGTLLLESSSVDLFTITTLSYTLTAGGGASGVEIAFEVLAPDLVPLWSATADTDAQGYVSVVYNAVDAHGILIVRARPSDSQFLVGGDRQDLLTVMTDAVIVTSLEPNPPSLGGTVTIVIDATDELGYDIINLDVTVSLYDPYDVPIKLGVFYSISVTIQDGQANVTFTPAIAGLHRIVVDSSGTSSVHGFTEEGFHTVHSPSSIEYADLDTDVSVGDTVQVTIRLSDIYDSPLVGMDVDVILDGPGALELGPVTLTTDAQGRANWQITIDNEGLWEVRADFAGMGVYLPVSQSAYIDVRYGTLIGVVYQGPSEVIAGLTNITLSVLLEDSGGTPLEGFTVRYEIYHEAYGLLASDSITQTGQLPELVNLTLDRGGNHTVVFLFDGTHHYHASTGGVSVIVLGTTSPVVNIQGSYDRADNLTVDVVFLDELDDPLTIDTLDLTLGLIGPSGRVSLVGRTIQETNAVSVIITGLPIGHYTLTIDVENATDRVGRNTTIDFTITTITRLSLVGESASGHVSTVHAVTALLSDSLDESLDGITVFVSLYDPNGREVYGSVLSTRTAITTENGQFEVSWTPSLTGNYTLELSFEGDELSSGSELSLVYLIRYPTQILLTLEDKVFNYGEDILPTIELRASESRVANKELLVTILGEDGELLAERVVVTDLRGNAAPEFGGLPAGNLTIIVVFNGTDHYSPQIVSHTFLVYPLVTTSAVASNNYVGSNCTIHYSLSVVGASTDWTGSLRADVHGPDGFQKSADYVVGPDTSIVISFLPQTSGVHVVNITISGLPAIVVYHDHTTVNVVIPAPQIQLDEGTIPVAYGGAIVGLLAFVVRRKLGRLLDGLPQDWEPMLNGSSAECSLGEY